MYAFSRCAVCSCGGRRLALCTWPRGQDDYYTRDVSERPRAFRNVITHATLRRVSRGRPDLAGCLPRCVRTGGQVKLCGEIVPTLVEPHAHSRAVGAQRGALTPDVRPVALASIGWPIWPVLDRARPCECHATIAHVTAAVVGVYWHRPRTEHLRLALCHQWCRTCDSPTHYLIIGISDRIGASWPWDPTQDA